MCVIYIYVCVYVRVRIYVCVIYMCVCIREKGLSKCRREIRCDVVMKDKSWDVVLDCKGDVTIQNKGRYCEYVTR